MIRFSLCVAAKFLSTPSCRGLATGIFEQLNLSQLKGEAKRRGLSQSGSKNILISRIQHVENHEKNSSVASASRRDASTVNQVKDAPPAYGPGATLNVKLPDLSIQPEHSDPHIPFLPDFWESSRTRGAGAIHHNAINETLIPRVLVIDGNSSTLGPTFGLSDPEPSESHTTQKTKADVSSFWRDVAEDIGITSSSDVPTLPNRFLSRMSSLSNEDSAQQKFQPKDLDADERRGLWAILFIFGGSWLAAGLFQEPRNAKGSKQ